MNIMTGVGNNINDIIEDVRLLLKFLVFLNGLGREVAGPCVICHTADNEVTTTTSSQAGLVLCISTFP